MEVIELGVSGTVSSVSQHPLSPFVDSETTVTFFIFIIHYEDFFGIHN